MEERTQIKFSNPDIDGTPIPQLITLEQEVPIEGTTEKEDGESFLWHKWLCTGSQYFMASESLDGMLKLIPNKVGKPLKIEKVPNPPSPYPYFQINGKNRDQIIAVVSVDTTDPSPPIQTETVPTSGTDGALARLEQKIDRVLDLLISEVEEDLPKEAELPF